MPKHSFKTQRGVACKRCGSDEWERRTDKRHSKGWKFDCAVCTRRRIRQLRADPAFTLLHSARQRAKAKRVPCSIEIEDVRGVFPADFRCPVLGIPLQFGKRSRATAGSPTLDRIRPEIGYVPGNIAVISNRANRIKNDATMNELQLVVQWLRAQPSAV